MRILPFLVRRRVPILLALALLLVGGYLLFGLGTPKQASLVVTRADVATEVSVAGSVIAEADAELGFAASGRIRGTYAVVGSRVAAGTVLAEIENGDEVATVAKQRANLDALYAGTRSEELAIDEADVASARASLVQTIKSAYVTADDAVRNRADVIFTTPASIPRIISLSAPAALEAALERERDVLNETLFNWQRSLASLSPISVEAAAETAETNITYIEAFLDHVATALSKGSSDQLSPATLASYEASVATGRTNVANAAADLANDHAALDRAEKSLTLAEAGPTTEDIAAATADLRSAQAALGATRVVAPFGGTVTRMDAKTGEIVSPADTHIAMQSDGIYQIEVYIPEVSIAGVAAGEAATTTLDAYGPQTAFGARVVRVDPAETMKNGVPTYKTTLVFTTEDPRIRSGMTANVVITTGVLTNAIVVPAGAVGRDSTGAYVTVLVGDKRERRTVETGSSQVLGRLEIVMGLIEGEMIALAP